MTGVLCYVIKGSINDRCIMLCNQGVHQGQVYYVM